MEQKQIDRWLRRQFRPIGWALLVYYGIMTFLVMLTMVWEVLSQLLEEGTMDLEALLNNGWGYLLAVAVGWVILHAWKGDGQPGEAKAAAPMTLGTAACLLTLTVGVQMGNSLWLQLLEWIMNRFDRSLMAQLEEVSGASESLSMFLFTALAAPVWEEVLFRKYILKTLRPYGTRFTIVMSAFLFGMLHGNLIQTPFAFLMGLVLGYTAVEYGLSWAIGLHLFNNLVLSDLLSRLLEQVSQPLGNLISLVIFGGGLLASVLILLANRDRIRAYFRGEAMDRRCVRCFFTNSGTVVFSIVMAMNMAVSLAGASSTANPAKFF